MPLVKVSDQEKTNWDIIKNPDTVNYMNGVAAQAAIIPEFILDQLMSNVALVPLEEKIKSLTAQLDSINKELALYYDSPEKKEKGRIAFNKLIATESFFINYQVEKDRTKD